MTYTRENAITRDVLFIGVARTSDIAPEEKLRISSALFLSLSLLLI